MSKAELESFYWGTYTEARAAGRELLMRQDFSRYQRLVDVGTGSGGLAVAFAEAHPHLHITAVDLPTTTPITERYVSEAGVADRVKVLPADVVIARLPGSYDVAILRGLLIVLPPDQAQRVLVNVGPAIAPGGAIYVMGNILDDSRDSPAELASYNLHFVNSLEDGQLYTEGEITGWLADAGFGDVMHEPATRAVGSGFLMGRRPA
jgi:predicted O-methyltransferase YrrM